ncbi:MAG: hypothetical protein R3F43_13090 [bacterium]
MLEKLRFTPLAPAGLDHLSVVPLAPTAAVPGLDALGRWLAGRRQRLAGRHGWRRADPAQVDFDALWRRTRHAAAFTRARDGRQSRWFVGDRCLLVDGDPADPRGFAVFSPGRWRRLPVMRLIDVWPPQAPDAVRRLVRFLWTDPFGGRPPRRSCTTRRRPSPRPWRAPRCGRGPRPLEHAAPGAGPARGGPLLHPGRGDNARCEPRRSRHCCAGRAGRRRQPPGARRCRALPPRCYQRILDPRLQHNQLAITSFASQIAWLEKHTGSSGWTRSPPPWRRGCRWSRGGSA